VEQEPRIHISDNLRNTDPALGESVVKATEVIDAAAIKLSRRSGVTQSRKKARTLPNPQRSPSVEQEVPVTSEGVANGCPRRLDPSSQIARAPRKSITFLNGLFRPFRIDGDGNIVECDTQETIGKHKPLPILTCVLIMLLHLPLILSQEISTSRRAQLPLLILVLQCR
jgi:hypothetical protein